MPDANDLLAAYAKNPPNRGELPGATILHAEESRVCADTIVVHMKLSDAGVIEDWSFTGKTSTITTACAAIFGESIVGLDAAQVLPLRYEYVRDLLGMDLTPKRHHAATLPILATRNALHAWLKDGKTDDFSDVMP